MMREILFRGKGKGLEKGKWIYGSFVEDTDLNACCIRDKSLAYELVDRKTVGQFTGLTDKNGKKIFEGDILAETWWGKKYEKNPILCKFHNGSFCFTQYRMWDTANDCKRAWVYKQRFMKKTLKYCEVIGNIHDNPELLKELQNV